MIVFLIIIIGGCMKKVGQLVTILLLLCVIYQLAVMFFLKEYHYKYTYTVNNEEYKID